MAGMFKSPKISGGMDQEAYMKMMGEQREYMSEMEAKQRANRSAEEEARVAREASERVRAQNEEDDRLRILREQEELAAAESAEAYDEKDADEGVANMFASLMSGVADEYRPE